MTSPGQKNLSSDILQEYIESIDALFLKLELAYHYQFYKVFGTDDKLNEGKKLWANSLKKYEVTIINEASEEIIHTQPYFPTLTDIVKLCEQLKKSTSLPSAGEAFIEARKSFSPRKKYNWSHPIIYLAGKKTGWNFLNEKDSFGFKSLNHFIPLIDVINIPFGLIDLKILPIINSKVF